MNEKMGVQGMSHHTMPTMVAPNFMQRLCQLLGQRVNVYLNCEGCTAPLTGTLHAVGQDYLELTNGTQTNAQVTIVPLWNVCAVNVAGSMDQICPAPTNPPGSITGGMGGMTPGCPKPGGDCPPMGFMPGSPFMGMDAKKEE
ncbi:hypothetical protein [Desulforamulus ferrireducens]|uniref:Uncharacterized protein n=1 Tax=Desulforamulus ferrireducens TaxID=1833852 RepID=A0A1S6IYL1_9FIRM|nr:hypothetical protein [Desulforamulus ferrireducens]AQS59867.1 hypothetical protein B0537_12695 [Desulforamulus ferrireducens]